MTTERHLDDEERTDPTGADGLAIEHAPRPLHTLEQGFVCLLNRLVDGISRRGRPAVGRALTA